MDASSIGSASEASDFLPASKLKRGQALRTADQEWMAFGISILFKAKNGQNLYVHIGNQLFTWVSYGKFEQLWSEHIIEQIIGLK